MSLPYSGKGEGGGGLRHDQRKLSKDFRTDLKFALRRENSIRAALIVPAQRAHEGSYSARPGRAHVARKKSRKAAVESVHRKADVESVLK